MDNTDDNSIKLSAGISKAANKTLRFESEQNHTEDVTRLFAADSTDQGILLMNEHAIEHHHNPTAHDVAAYILQKCGTMTAMKLQKLVYYCQAWSLVWDEAPLFDEDIRAWANGPVVPALYERHKGLFSVSSWKGDSSNLTDKQKDTINKVLEFYGDKSSQWLSDLTHIESPWLDARKGLYPGERGNNTISLASMAEYYSSL